MVMADMSTIAPLVEGDGIEVLAFYIGGDTPNVPLMTSVKALKTRYLLPIWTRSDPGEVNVATDAQAAIKHLGLIGAPKHTLVGLDYETAKDAQYVEDFSAILEAAGYLTLLYGSKSTVTANPKPSGGYWDADWTGEKHLTAGSTATQYVGNQQAGRPYDLSVIVADAPLWDTQAGTPVTPPTVPATKSDPKVVELQRVLNEYGAHLEEDGEKGPLTKRAFMDIADRYGTITVGYRGPGVSAIQAMLNTWYSVITSQPLKVDGEFGPATLASVEEFQLKRKVGNSEINGHGDGRVGPNTKAALAA